MNKYSPPPSQASVKGLSHVQARRKLALLAAAFVCLAAMVTSRSVWIDAHDGVHELIQTTGILLMGAAIAGRTWCSLYIGGRKMAVIVDTGPYSLCRNPLYLFTFIGVAGAGAQLGSLVFALLALALTWSVFYFVVLREEAFLTAGFGGAYTEYKVRTPRFLPDWRLWKPVELLEVRPALVVRTFFDASLFLLAIPLAEGFELLQSAYGLPVLWLLP